MQKIDLRSIITEEFRNEIQESFAYATGFGVVFTDDEGNHIGPGGNFCRFCNKINETEEGAHFCALSNKHAIQLALERKKPSIYICHAGLVNIEIPLIYDGTCVGAITAGQVLCTEENAYPRDEISSEIHWLSDPELAAYFGEIEVMSRQKIEATTTALSNLTNYIIQKLAYSQIQQQLSRKTAALLAAENQLKQAKLDALQRQVTPHFMFNIISTISRLLALKEYDTAGKMLDSFARMLRYSLSNLRPSVLLSDELDYIENYLAIQKIRFGDCIDYTVRCDPALKALRIPFFSLQPLVENSIEHGLLPGQADGRLTLTCERHARSDTITITDNGVGISPQQLKAIRSRISSNSDSSQHVGLRNCYKRFQLMFGERFSFSISSARQTGTKIVITLLHGET